MALLLSTSLMLIGLTGIFLSISHRSRKTPVLRTKPWRWIGGMLLLFAFLVQWWASSLAVAFLVWLGSLMVLMIIMPVTDYFRCRNSQK